ncbi:putative poly [ADP-ribose] polymerase 3 [Cynara cardunculus var. scolymus]|uniref:putative poly [ADP-ribose] polymerase 3 n=1 Tax=Cynara cardunculus var. scolymus TaxID=59895 RepID=UPI000D62D120|nr:putative poly [ADP-ribose] polymerase 3 [Cynara cardunculus var. scolymus]
MKVHESKSQNHPSGDEEKIMTRKQKAEKQQDHPNKKPKSEDNQNGNATTKPLSDIVAEFDNFCKATSQHLSIDQMREILEANNADASGSDDAVVPRCQDMMFYGALRECPVCGGTLRYDGQNYTCTGSYSEWSTCTYNTREPPRLEEPIRFPDFVQESGISDLLLKHQDPKGRPKREMKPTDRPFTGMIISLSGRLSRTHQYWKSKIEKHGGKVANHIIGATCLVVSPSERDRGGSSKVTEALEREIPVVREAWLSDSIEKQEPLPLDAYDVVSDLAVDGKGIPWAMQDPSQEALESLNAELKMYGKRGVHKDSNLDKEGGVIFEKDGILYNCAFSVCDRGRKVNEFCVMQLIMVPENRLHLYFKRGKVGADPRAEERVEERENIDDTIKEFAKLFEELTGNEFEPWEREKKIQKKHQKFFPIDMDDGYDVRYGGLGIRQLGTAAAHCKLDPLVANFMKVLCSQEIYRYALMELGLDAPDLPVAMLTDLHIRRCEEVLLEFVENLSTTKEEQKAGAIWSDFSQRWFTLLHSTRPFIFRDTQDLADHGASVLETVRDINVASRIIEDMTGATIDDPLFDRYKRLGCSISPLEKESEDYKMILKYVDKTYEPVKVGEISYGAAVQNIFQVEVGAGPSYDEIKKLPNKVLLWCGTRSSNLVRHLHKGFLPAVCTLPVSGYMFGRAIVCSDAAAEAARFGYTAVDRPEGFLILAVASLGNDIMEVTSPPEDPKSLEEKKAGVKGLGRKKTDEKEHFVWKDDIKVPCGSLVASEHKDSPLEYNEYAVYDPKQVSIRFLVEVKFEEQDVEYEEVDPAGADAPVQ